MEMIVVAGVSLCSGDGTQCSISLMAGRGIVLAFFMDGVLLASSFAAGRSALAVIGFILAPDVDQECQRAPGCADRLLA
ncbi:MAG: hypothetical protein WCD66_12095, partial [Rhodanobacteraceae bacterium]